MKRILFSVLIQILWPKVPKRPPVAGRRVFDVALGGATRTTHPPCDVSAGWRLLRCHGGPLCPPLFSALFFKREWQWAKRWRRGERGRDNTNEERRQSHPLNARRCSRWCVFYWPFLSYFHLHSKMCHLNKGHLTASVPHIVMWWKTFSPWTVLY